MSDDVALEPSSTEARPGEALAYAVHNRGAGEYWVIDEYALERQDPGGWTDVTIEEGFKLLPHTIAPGGRVQQWAEIPPGATSSTLRIWLEKPLVWCFACRANKTPRATPSPVNTGAPLSPGRIGVFPKFAP
jgi:hypothetical protein